MKASPTTAAVEAALRPNFDVERIRADFPILHQEVNGHPLVYLDSAASAQRPRQVIEALVRFYEHDYANVHRGVHTLSQRASEQYERARTRVANFLGAGSDETIVFTRGGTEALNLIAESYGRTFLEAGDEVVLTVMEHHSNIVPWQLLRDHVGVVIKAVPVDERGVLDMDAYRDMVGPRTKLVAVAHASNVLGTINPIAEIARIAHEAGAVVVVDGCQSVPHMKVDVRALGADFYVFSGHKVYGPGGIGALYGRRELLRRMPPWQGGGSMIASVSLEHTEYASPPARFEAGTPAIADAVALTAALDYVEDLGFENIQAHEAALTRRAQERLAALPGVRLIGTAPEKAGIVSFVLDDAHAHDVGTVLDRRGIAVRTGHHCAQILAERFGIASTTRASFAIYNTEAEVDALAEAVDETIRMFRR